jgi:polyhydroxyalkanoate synthesis repressor PhaR
MEGPLTSSKLVIRKYGNRRLYDTHASKYVNLDEIAAMVRQGRDLQVLDAKTGEDMTRVILTQIIVDEARTKPTGVPIEFLRQLIMASDQVGRDFIMWYLNSAFDAYRKVQHSVQSGIAEVQSAALSPMETIRSFLTGPSRPDKTPDTAALRELQDRITELESRLSARAETKPKKSARRSERSRKR